MKNKPIQRCRNIHALPEYERLWLRYRAGEFDLIDGVEVPVYTDARLAKNFTKARRFKVSKFQVWRFVHREAPELAARRGDAYPFAWRDRRKGI